jgi:hypothetical protein
MPILQRDNGDVIVTNAGWYALDGDEVRSPVRPDAREPVGLLVSPLGDFAVSGAVPGARGRLTVSGRPPLGGIELLSDGAVIVVEHDEGAGRTRLTYTRDGPPVALTLPAATTLRCAYSWKPLGGATTVRCSKCFTLYHESAWETELSRICPACGWSPRGPRP